MAKKLAAALPILRDVAGISGVGLLSFGCWLAWRPLGFIVAGALLLAGSLLAARAD